MTGSQLRIGGSVPGGSEQSDTTGDTPGQGHPTDSARRRCTTLHAANCVRTMLKWRECVPVGTLSTTRLSDIDRTQALERHAPTITYTPLNTIALHMTTRHSANYYSPITNVMGVPNGIVSCTTSRTMLLFGLAYVGHRQPRAEGKPTEAGKRTDDGATRPRACRSGPTRKESHL